VAGAWLGALALAAVAQTPQPALPAAAGPPPAAAASAPEEIAPRLSPLLGLLLGRVVDAAIERTTGDTTLGLFRRLARQMQGEPAAAETTAGHGSPLTPALGYAMEQLDPDSFAVVRPIPVGGSGAMLRTGDVFVLQFSTNLPGQVRLENVDPTGRVADLGTYNVLVDQLNRLPRDRGIQLQGQPGMERLRFLFYPCLPPEAAGKPWVADFQGRLPPCAGTQSPLQVAGVSPGAYGTVAPRALVNLAQPDATMVFAGSTEYQPGEVTAMEARIRHEARGR
jgi:hypothetical protein